MPDPCLRCGTPRLTKTKRGGRGLCKACWGTERREGRLQEWPLLGGSDDLAWEGGWWRDGLIMRPCGTEPADAEDPRLDVMREAFR